MANIFLTSSLGSVAKHLAKNITNAKRFLFITTASETEDDDKKWLQDDRQNFIDAGFLVDDYTVTGKTKDEIEAKLEDFDGVVMEGGSTIYLLQQLQKTNSIEVFGDFVASGKYYIGSSAGSIVAGPDVYVTREPGELETAPQIDGFNGLGITEIIVHPHWGSESFKESYLATIMPHSYVPDYKMVLLSDSQYLIVNKQDIRIIDVNKE